MQLLQYYLKQTPSAEYSRDQNAHKNYLRQLWEETFLCNRRRDNCPNSAYGFLIKTVPLKFAFCCLYSPETVLNYRC